MMAGTPFEFRVRRSPRARRVRVSVDGAGEVEVVLPKRAPERAAAQAVRELTPWIERRRRTLARAAAELARPEGTVPFLGQDLRLVPQPGRERVHRRGDELLVPKRDAAAAIERWYRRQARAEIAPRLDAAVARAGTSYTGLTIRGQKTRWASCSTTGHMSFNWRLLLAPEAVLDYVVEHEVCHLERMDHSPRFWALLESRVPGLARARALAAALRPDARALDRRRPSARSGGGASARCRRDRGSRPCGRRRCRCCRARTATPCSSSAARAAATSSTWNAIGCEWGENSRPNASDCMTAMVTVPFSNSPAGMLPQRFERSRPSTSP